MTIIRTDEQRNLRDALSRLTYRQTWTLCVEALRQMRKSSNKTRFNLAALQERFYPLLRKQLNIADTVRFSPLGHALDQEFGAHVLEFLLWLERSGLVYHLSQGSGGNYVDWMRVLPAGVKFFDGDNDASPYHPEWIARTKRDCTGITDEIVSSLEDALACFQHRLNRPAVALLGVAFEAVMIELFERMAAIYGVKMTPPKPQKASEFIKAIRSGIDARVQDREARASVRRACDFADDLRERRNQASHPLGASFDDASEVDELFILAARKLPQLWQLH